MELTLSTRISACCAFCRRSQRMRSSKRHMLCRPKQCLNVVCHIQVKHRISPKSDNILQRAFQASYLRLLPQRAGLLDRGRGSTIPSPGECDMRRMYAVVGGEAILAWKPPLV